MRSRGGKWGFLAVALCLFAPAVAQVDGGGGDVDPEVARLARFWSFDRYVLDGGIGPFVRTRHASTVLAKAKPDECFTGIGLPNAAPPATDGTCAEGRPKVNDAYVWGLARVGKKLFFGTLANTNCLVEAGYLDQTEPHQNELYVCEFGARAPSGDFRAPNLFRYDDATGELVSLNPPAGTADDIRRRSTSGFRSAGSLGNTVFIAGPAARVPGITLFVYDAVTDALLASRTLNDTTSPATRYTNVRQWANANGGLYVGIGTAGGTGRVLRWTPTTEDPYAFTTVGILPTDAANMVFHGDGRLYVTTWPGGGRPAGLYRSPPIPASGLTDAHRNHPDWTTAIWTADQYDPDPVTALRYGGGALASWKGRIVFGTMHVPLSATQAAMEEHALAGSEFLRTFLGTHRPISIFEVKFPAGRPKVSLLYGEKYLPVFDPATNGYTIRYDEAHRTGFAPRWGPSGFGNFFNSYTWTMRVLRGDLFVGTFDWSQLARAEATANAESGSRAQELFARLRGVGLVVPREGADLIRFDRTEGIVWAESVDGMGNDRNYGIRTMLDDGAVMYLGTANPMNLDPKGGWELLRVTPW